MAEFATGIIASFSRVKTLRGTQLFKGKLIVNVLTNEVQRRRESKAQRIISSICTLCHELAVNRTHGFFPKVFGRFVVCRYYISCLVLPRLQF